MMLSCRNSLLTGRSPDQIKVFGFEATANEQLGGDGWNVFHSFRRHGYLTLAVGKVFHWAEDIPRGSLSSENGKYFPSQYDQEWGCRAPFKPGSPEADPSSFAWAGDCMPMACGQPGRRKGDCGIKGRAYVEPSEVHEEHFFDSRVAGIAMQKLRMAAGLESPFMLAVGFKSPHLHWHMPLRVWEAYAGNDTIYPPEMSLPPEGVHLVSLGDMNLDNGVWLTDGRVFPSPPFRIQPRSEWEQMPRDAQIEVNITPIQLSLCPRLPLVPERSCFHHPIYHPHPVRCGGRTRHA